MDIFNNLLHALDTESLRLNFGVSKEGNLSNIENAFRLRKTKERSIHMNEERKKGCPENRVRIQDIQTANVAFTECKGFLLKTFFYC